jgi:phosphoribosyl 1,2-cyclic phosphodiesterase
MRAEAPTIIQLPRGGLYARTSAGPVQFGIPPESIKDVMALGLDVPAAYVVPREPFDRRRGLNVAEFEFPTYYSFFLLKRRARLVVESAAVEQRIRTVFQETLFGPNDPPHPSEFADGFPESARPLFLKESDYFRRQADGSRIQLDDLVEFVMVESGVAKLTPKVRIALRKDGYVLYDGAREFRVPLGVQLPPREQSLESAPRPFKPPDFGITVLGASHGFDPAGKTTGIMLWMGGRGLLVDPPIDSTEYLRARGVAPKLIDGIILTHCHADHDAGTFQKLLEEGQVALYTTPHVLGSFLRKYSALSGLKEDFLRRLFVFHPARIGAPTHVRGGEIWFHYSLHSIPTIGFAVFYGGKSISFSADTLYDPERIVDMFKEKVIGKGRCERLLDFGMHHSVIVHEAGIPPLHTPVAVLAMLPEEVKRRILLVHIAAKDVPPGSGLVPARVGLEHTIRIDVTPPSFRDAIGLLDSLTAVEFLRDLPLSRARSLLQVARQISVPAGETIVKQGTRGDSFYIIVNGTVVVQRQGEVLKKYRAGDYFGETALIMDQPRSADVIAKTPVDLVAIDRNDFLSLLHGSDIVTRLANLARVRERGTWELFDKNSVLGRLTSAQKTQLQTYLKPYEAQKNEVLWADSEPPRRAFLVDSAAVMLDLGSSTPRAELGGEDMRPFKQGAFLGEIDALRTGVAARTAARVVEAGKLFAIEREDLSHFFDGNPGVLLSFVGTRFVE